jgi:hypothetical protein
VAAASSEVTDLTEGMLKAMLISKLKAVTLFRASWGAHASKPLLFLLFTETGDKKRERG